MKSKMEFRIDNDLKQDFIRICKRQDEVPSKVLRGMIENYIADNASYYEMFIEPFIAECEEILSQKIDEALHKDSLVFYLTRGSNIDGVVLINEMLDFLTNVNIEYNIGYGYHLTDMIPPSGDIDDWGEFANAEDFVEWFLEEFI